MKFSVILYSQNGSVKGTHGWNRTEIFIDCLLNFWPFCTQCKFFLENWISFQEFFLSRMVVLSVHMYGIGSKFQLIATGQVVRLKNLTKFVFGQFCT